MQKNMIIPSLVWGICFSASAVAVENDVFKSERCENKTLAGMEKILLVRLETMCHKALNGDLQAHKAVFCLVGRVCDSDYYIDEISENYLMYYGLLLPGGNLHPLVPKLVINPRIFDLLREIVGDMWDELTHFGVAR